MWVWSFLYQALADGVGKGFDWKALLVEENMLVGGNVSVQISLQISYAPIRVHFWPLFLHLGRFRSNMPQETLTNMEQSAYAST